MIFVESRAWHGLCRLARRESTDNRDLQITEPWMSAKKKFPQQQLWMLPIAPAGEELPDPKRQELTVALADLLWQFACASSEETNQEHGGDDGHDEFCQDHA